MCIRDRRTAEVIKIKIGSILPFEDGRERDMIISGQDVYTCLLYTSGYVGAYENVDNDRFFTATDAELEQWSRGLAKQDRKRRNVGLKILLFFVIVIVLAAAAGVFAYTQGYGYPTVQTVTQELFSDPSGAADKVFSADVDKDAIPAMLDPVVTDSNVTIDGVSRSMTESTVYATAKTEEGGSVQYRISMVRDGITWKVSNVELYFPSQA